MLEPLSSVLTRQAPGSLDRARSVVRGRDRAKLTQAYRSAFASGKRTIAFVLAEALTALGLPPCFRFAHTPSVRPLPLNQQLDAFAHDVQWLAKRHPRQRNEVRGERYKRLFDEFVHPDEFEWLREVEYWFNSGKRDVWPIVRGLQLSDQQEWECKWLRSSVVNRKADALAGRRDEVYKAIMCHLPRTERGMSTEAAKGVLKRRFRLWVCGQMARDGSKVSPASAARLYEAWTGEQVSPVIARRHLEWVKANVPQAGNRGHGGAEKPEMLMSDE